VPAPEQLTIETPEHIALEFPLAGVGSRFLAMAFDSLLQGIAVVVLVAVGLFISALAGTGSSFSGLGLWGLAILFAIGFAIYSGYFAVFESLWMGQTPGKRLVGLRVLDVSGRPVTVHAAIVRNLLRLIDQLPGVYALGILSILVTRRQQRIGDLAAGTVVVHERLDGRVVLPSAAPAAVRVGAHRLTAEEIAVVEGFLRRRDDLDPWPRRQAAHSIATRLKAKLDAVSSEDDEVLLELIAAEYRAGEAYR
jgi:uncharacterized RDD family membrane protein YckC